METPDFQQGKFGWIGLDRSCGRRGFPRDSTTRQIVPGSFEGRNSLSGDVLAVPVREVDINPPSRLESLDSSKSTISISLLIFVYSTSILNPLKPSSPGSYQSGSGTQ
jgi:hypothetical protein